MPRAVIHPVLPPVGPLPFTHAGELAALDGTILEAGIPCAVWPARSRTTALGKTADHEGEAALAYADPLAAPNRKLIIDGRTYNIVSAVPHGLLPHVALLLREQIPGGGH